MSRWRTVDDIVAARDRRSAEIEALNANAPAMAAVHDGVRLRDGLTADVYVPPSKTVAVYVHAHGGAWNRGSARDCRKRAMQVAEAGFLVVNLDYRLAPENPFPAAVADVVFAVGWAAREYGLPVALGGESAGANLAAVAATVVSPAALLLVSGIYDVDALLREGTSDTELIVRAYLGQAGQPADPLVSPLRAPNLHAFPPAYVVCGDADPLLPQSLAFAGALRAVALRVVPGAGHGFNRLPEFFGEVERYRTWLANASTSSGSVSQEHMNRQTPRPASQT
ncbi:MAG TPA: alpha/beta hydrolase [Gaiellaceae bacterium]